MVVESLGREGQVDGLDAIPEDRHVHGYAGHHLVGAEPEAQTAANGELHGIQTAALKEEVRADPHGGADLRFGLNPIVIDGNEGGGRGRKYTGT